MNFKDLTGSLIHGFRFTSSRAIPEIDGVLHLATYEKNGAELAFLERDDVNKTFSIAFKTIPTDDTGVFHILEHSVLCGSRKFPVKEPFVELLKSSLKTFLNAMTFSDKTVYPISSRNQKDFLNLTDVYMDAVFYPRAIKDKNVFLQEGWHFETEDENSPLTFNGVVYNEMKGAYSSADEVEMEEMSKLLYEGSCYAYDSGGDPKAIPSLTFEYFVEQHSTYYHPSNSRIFLDGKIELDSTLELLDSYLKDFDKKSVIADVGTPIKRKDIRKDISYEIADSDNESSMTRICLGYYLGSYEEIKKAIAFNIITDAIAGTNESVFKKAMLESGLCEDISFFPYDGISENSVLIEIKNLKEENTDKAIELVNETIKQIVKEGIDKKVLESSFNALEFKHREQDGGSYPKGIVNSISILNTWLYGGDPIDGIRFDEVLKSLRSELDGRYYEELLESVTLKTDHNAMLVMHPSKTLGAEKAEEELAKLQAIKEALTDEELKQIAEEAKHLHMIQNAEDSKENLATLPKLSIEDIEKEPEFIPYTERYENGTRVIYTKAATSGITYLCMLFDASDLDPYKLSCLSTLQDLLGSVKTKRHSAIELQTLIRSNTGSLNFSTSILNKEGIVTPYLKVTASYLDHKEDVVLSIIGEILTESDFSDFDSLGRIIKQIKNAAFESICASGHSAAINRCGSYLFTECAITEYTDGIEFYKLIKELDLNFEDKKQKYKEDVEGLCNQLFTRNRLILSYWGKENPSLSQKAAELFPSSDKAVIKQQISPLGILNEGIVIPSGVSYAARSGNLFGIPSWDGKYTVHGSLSVARSILSYGYLWNTVRVIGGAYGSGLSLRKSGAVSFYSYRDPNAANTLNAFLGAPEALRLAACDDLTGFIIGAIGDGDPLITPKNIGSFGLICAMSEETYEKRLNRRRQILATDKDTLLRLADDIEDAIKSNALCVIGGRDKIEAAKDHILNVVEI